MMVNVLMNVSPCCLSALFETFLGCFLRGRRGRDGMAVVSSNAVYGELYSIQHYVIKFVSDLRQVGGFLRVHLFPPQINLTATI
jgi:hypothetical protein